MIFVVYVIPGQIIADALKIETDLEAWAERSVWKTSRKVEQVSVEILYGEVRTVVRFVDGYVWERSGLPDETYRKVLTRLLRQAGIELIQRRHH